MERAAWFCPSCQKHHAPHVETCPAEAVQSIAPFTGPWITQPAFDADRYRQTMAETYRDPCAGCKGACGNAACPKLARITSQTATAVGNLPFHVATYGWEN